MAGGLAVTTGTATAAPPPPVPGIRCDPNYDGCVPIDDDVDCLGGQGNGPSYVEGPVQVLGRDIYRLDDDGDGVACGDVGDLDQSGGGDDMSGEGGEMGGGNGDGDLADTGSSSAALVGTAALTLLSGGVLLAASRRRTV